jgi:amino acid transporter
MSEFKLPSCCSRCLAEEAEESWQVGTEEVQSEGNTMTSILHHVQIPLCQACHCQLKRQCVLYWAVGILVGSALAGVLAYVGPQLLASIKDVPVGLVILGLVVFVALSAWVIAWILRHVFVESRLAKYDPTTPRLAFGNKQYQELFDQANDLFRAEGSLYGN